MAPRGMAWSWPDAGRCAICAIPAALVTATDDPSKGLAWAIGILPAALIGMAPTRRARAKVMLVGALFGLSIVVGSLLARNAVVAMLGILLAAYGSAVLAARQGERSQLQH